MTGEAHVAGQLEVSRLGLGTMGMSAFYAGADDAEAVRTTHRAPSWA